MSYEVYLKKEIWCNKGKKDNQIASWIYYCFINLEHINAMWTALKRKLSEKIDQ